jgi:hypothetical protein
MNRRARRRACGTETATCRPPVAVIHCGRRCSVAPSRTTASSPSSAAVAWAWSTRRRTPGSAATSRSSSSPRSSPTIARRSRKTPRCATRAPPRCVRTSSGGGPETHCGAAVREPGSGGRRLLRRRHDRRGARQARPGARFGGDRPQQHRRLPGDREVRERDRRGARHGVPPDRQGALAEGRRGEPHPGDAGAGGGRGLGSADRALAGLVRRGARGRLPGADGNRHAGGGVAASGAGRRGTAAAGGAAHLQPRRLRRVHARGGHVVARRPGPGDNAARDRPVRAGGCPRFPLRDRLGPIGRGAVPRSTVGARRARGRSRGSE